MMGSGAATPGWSDHDRAMALLKVATDPKATEKRLKDLHDATRAHDEARKTHEKNSKELDVKWTKLLVKESEIHAREQNLQTQIQAHQHDKDGTAAEHARIFGDITEREKALKDGQDRLAQGINDFTHYREREKEALQRRVTELDRREQAIAEKELQLGEAVAIHDRRVDALAEIRDLLAQRLQRA
jgi:chromosome segregation ATPase